MEELIEEHDSIDLRSKAFQEVLGEPPSWLQRWGITAVVVAVIALFVVGHFLEYPESITASIHLETANPPIEVVATALGTISDYLPEDTLVEATTTLARISDNSGDFNAILALSEELATYTAENKVLPNLDRFEISKIGILQKDLFEYLQLYQGKSNAGNNFQNQAINIYNQNIAAIKKEIVDLGSRIQSKKEELAAIPARRKSLKDTYAESVDNKDIAPIQQLLSDEKRLKDDIKIFEGQITQKRRNIKDEELKKSNIKNDVQGTQNTRQNRLELSLLRLKTEVEAWKQQHIIKAPITGTLYHLNKLKAKDLLIDKGDKIFSIVPLGSQDSIEGKLYLRSEEAIKVNIGQKVKIKFSNFRPSDYGLLNGVVTDKATIPQNGQYQITVAVEKNMATTKGKNIPFSHQLQGEAKIITKDRRFTGIILDQFKEMLNR